MTDYTPTTAEMLEAYYRSLRYTSRTSRDVDAEFYRWFAEVKAQERERIVKMLEDGAVLCAGGCGCFVDGGEGDPTCANCY